MSSYFVPSEIARLVLGYLINQGLHETWRKFLLESPQLAEFRQIMLKGRVPSTTILGKTLVDILNEFAETNQKVTSVLPVHRTQVAECSSTVNKTVVPARPQVPGVISCQHNENRDAVPAQDKLITECNSVDLHQLAQAKDQPEEEIKHQRESWKVGNARRIDNQKRESKGKPNPAADSKGQPCSSQALYTSNPKTSHPCKPLPSKNHIAKLISKNAATVFNGTCISAESPNVPAEPDKLVLADSTEVNSVSSQSAMKTTSDLKKVNNHAHSWEDTIKSGSQNSGVKANGINSNQGVTLSKSHSLSQIINQGLSSARRSSFPTKASAVQIQNPLQVKEPVLLGLSTDCVEQTKTKQGQRPGSKQQRPGSLKIAQTMPNWNVNKNDTTKNSTLEKSQKSNYEIWVSQLLNDQGVCKNNAMLKVHCRNITEINVAGISKKSNDNFKDLPKASQAHKEESHHSKAAVLDKASLLDQLQVMPSEKGSVIIIPPGLSNAFQQMTSKGEGPCSQTSYSQVSLKDKLPITSEYPPGDNSKISHKDSMYSKTSVSLTSGHNSPSVSKVKILQSQSKNDSAISGNEHVPCEVNITANTDASIEPVFSAQPNTNTVVTSSTHKNKDTTGLSKSSFIKPSGENAHTDNMKTTQNADIDPCQINISEKQLQVIPTALEIIAREKSKESGLVNNSKNVLEMSNLGQARNEEITTVVKQEIVSQNNEVLNSDLHSESDSRENDGQKEMANNVIKNITRERMNLLVGSKQIAEKQPKRLSSFDNITSPHVVIEKIPTLIPQEGDTVTTSRKIHQTPKPHTSCKSYSLSTPYRASKRTYKSTNKEVLIQPAKKRQLVSLNKEDEVVVMPAITSKKRVRIVQDISGGQIIKKGNLEVAAEKFTLENRKSSCRF